MLGSFLTLISLAAAPASSHLSAPGIPRRSSSSNSSRPGNLNCYPHPCPTGFSLPLLFDRILAVFVAALSSRGLALKPPKNLLLGLYPDFGPVGLATADAAVRRPSLGVADVLRPDAHAVRRPARDAPGTAWIFDPDLPLFVIITLMLLARACCSPLLT